MSMNITDESRKNYAEVMAKLDCYFKVRKNLIFERAKFNRREQGEGESAEEYITELYALIETCEFNELRDYEIDSSLKSVTRGCPKSCS